MRRRRVWAPKAPRAPKAPKPQPIPRPKNSELVSVYKKIVAAAATARIAALYEAIEWWDKAIPYFISKAPLTADQQKTFNVANKARALGIGGQTDGEKESGLRACIVKYEAVWKDETVPSVKRFYEKYDAMKDQLDKAAAAVANKHQMILDALNSAFGTMGVTFDVHKSERPRQLTENSKIMLSTDLARTLARKAKDEGLLPVIFSEAHTALFATAIDRDAASGQHTTNMSKLASNVPVLFANIMKYLNTVPRQKVFRHFDEAAGVQATATAASTPRAAAPRAPRQPGAPRPAVSRGAGARVGGRYLPGSAMAILFERIADGKPHNLADVFKDLPVSDPMGRMKWLAKHGQQDGTWDITFEKQTVTLKMRQRP